MTTEQRNKLDQQNIDLMKNYLERLTGSRQVSRKHWGKNFTKYFTLRGS